MGSVWSFDAPFPGARWHDTWMLASMIILILFQVQTGVAPGGKLGFSSWIHGFENGSFNRYLFLLNHEPYEKNNGILMVESISNRLDVSRNSSFFFFLLMKHHRKRFLWPKIDHNGWGDDQWMGSSKMGTTPRISGLVMSTEIAIEAMAH